MTPRQQGLPTIVLAALALAACADPAAEITTSTSPRPAGPAPGSTAEPPPGSVDHLFPDIVGAIATHDPEAGTWRFDVTVSSPYDTAQRYADAWRVVGPDGTVYGVRELAHDHASEQPFTRSLGGVAIPDDVTSVTVEGRDQINGYGGARVTVELVRS